MPIPAGHKALLIRVQFDTALTDQVADAIQAVSTISAIQSDADVEAANGALKKAKALVKLIGQQRGLMSVELDNEKKALINLERSLTDPLENCINTLNNSIVAYQREQIRKKEEERKAIEAQKQAELAAAQAETDRKKRIKSIIERIKLNGYEACHSATLATINDSITKMASANYTSETFMEFLPDMQALHIELTGAFNKRKIELEQLAQVEKINSDAAAKLKEDQAAAARAEAERLQKEKEEQASKEADAQENTIANIQMNAEFKEAQVNKLPPGVRRVWTFDEENVDLSLLPIEYHTFDKKKIKEAISAGAREIPGVKITQEVQNVAR